MGDVEGGMNKRYVVRLTGEERGQLWQMLSTGKTAAQKLTHAHVLLKADAGDGGAAWIDQRIAETFGVHLNTVVGIRQRFVEEGLASALNRKKRSAPGRQPKLDGRGEAKLIALHCGTPPAGRARWTLHLLADRLVEMRLVDSISHETVRKVLKKTS